jgi:hypothetical protein
MYLKIIVFIFICNVLNGQKVDFLNKSYTEGKISLITFKKINASNLKFTADSVSYFNKDISEFEKTSLTNINYVRLQEGTQTGKIALIAGSASALITFSAFLQVSAQNKQLKTNAGKTALLIFVSGTAIGVLIGAATGRWKTYYIGKEYSSKLNITPKFDVLNKNFGLAMQIKL